MQVLPPISILILDDERIDRHRLARLCSGLDRECRLTNANNLNDFQTLIDSTPFDLIFVDYRLPDGNGFDAVELAQLSAKNATAKVIMVTGLSQDDLEDQALHSGCVAFLSKDHLTAAQFQSALARSELIATAKTPQARAHYTREQAEELLMVFASQTARDLKPYVSRALRQLREVKTRDTANPCAQTEQTFLSLWEILARMELQSGAEVITSITAPIKPQVVQADRVQRRKPPSPFSSIRTS